MTQVKSMQRIFVFLYSLFARMLIMNPLIAIAPQDKQDVKNDLRILELLPNLLCPLAVDPGISADFLPLITPVSSLLKKSWRYPDNPLPAEIKKYPGLSV